MKRWKCGHIVTHRLSAHDYGRDFSLVACWECQRKSYALIQRIIGAQVRKLVTA